MSNLFKIHAGPVMFTLDSARAILPTIIKITERHSCAVKALITRIEAVRGNDALLKDLENQVDTQVTQWQNKCKALGVDAKGLWLADFDNGQGFYCWKFPETTLNHFHSYTEGFQARVKIDDELKGA